MSSVKKLLAGFNAKEIKILGVLIKKIGSSDWRDLDIKKLKGYPDILRVRRGRLRIIFTKDGEDIYILSIDRRRENIYKL